MNFRYYLKNNWLMLWYNLTIVYTFSFLIYDTFTSIPALILSILHLFFHVFSRYSKSTTEKYILAAFSLASLLGALIIAHPPFINITNYVYNIPLIYALLLNDFFSTILVGVAINYIFFEYSLEVGDAVAKTTSISMITASIGYTVIAHLFRNLTAEKDKYQQLSITDSLTDLATLKYSLEIGNKMLEQENSITLIEIDLDYFKQVNDNYGHLRWR